MQKHSFVLFVLSWFNYNISAVFLLFYFADDLVSQKNGETQMGSAYWHFLKCNIKWTHMLKTEMETVPFWERVQWVRDGANRVSDKLGISLLSCRWKLFEYTEPVPIVIWVMYPVCIGFRLLSYYMCEQQWIWNRQCASE